MLTSSHAAWTWLLAPRRRGWAAVGAALPDLPALAWTVLARRVGLSGAAMWQEVYHRPGRERVHTALHSAFAPAALAGLARGRGGAGALALGWAGHLAADLASHRDDAWPHLWPASSRRLRSPVSYWQPEAGGTAWIAADAALLALAALRARTLPARAGLALAAALAAAPLSERLRAEPWRERRRACSAPRGRAP